MSCKDRLYPIFKEGDEVYTDHKYRSIQKYKPYTVLRCYRPHGYIDSYPVVLIEVYTDRGFKSSYSSDKFKKTETQIRQDKLDHLI